MIGVYAQSEIEWTRAFRTTLGLRADVYQFSVTSDNPLNSGDGSDGLVSPKFAAVFGPWAGTELYANAGHGLSQQRRARRRDLASIRRRGEPAERVTPLVRARGAEVGVRTVRMRGLQSTFSLWYLGIDSELLFVGDAGTTEAGRPSRRVGIEWTNYWRAAPWLTADADVSFSRARFTDDDPAGDNIPGALDRVVSGGITVEPRQPRLRQPPRPPLRPASADRGREREIARHDAVEWRSSATASPTKGAAGARSVQPLRRRGRRTSTTSTRRACRANRRRASRTFTRIRRCRDRRASVFSSRSDGARQGLRARFYERRRARRGWASNFRFDDDCGD